ncbi:MAG TPA: hypothetical protein VJQ58_02245 [Burkholderiales bacterium]|nr:hypothetical protein [Burkholderiales bacterium]
MNRMPASPLVMRALEVAENRLGMEALSRRLGAPETTIRDWRMGFATMPERKWFRLVDILMDIEPDWDKG